MSALLIDAGNTRIKWALAADDAAASSAPLGTWLAFGAEFHTDLRTTADTAAPRLATSIAASIAASAGARIARVLIANVAGQAVRDLLTAALADPSLAIAPDAIEWFASVPSRAGVRNAYRNPLQLGCDRFAAAIAAHALCPGKAIVVANCGTATTIDAITPDGTFLGGMILPGLGLMASSLAKNTAQLPQIAPGARLPEGFADNTGDAILTGCLAAQAGAIERAYELHQAVECIISGGAAPYVSPAVPVPHRHVENIVLIGLQAVLNKERPC
ncbi:type III pantothenate kinase [Pseudoduganella sp. RAF53_2]|uniref:type III pantothenate kinase n=1 Tax=unclassified Pseudoduganella TaxID=2637179 RepID=UPI003F9833D0